jgi:hypothetical protein
MTGPLEKKLAQHCTQAFLPRDIRPQAVPLVPARESAMELGESGIVGRANVHGSCTSLVALLAPLDIRFSHGTSRPKPTSAGRPARNLCGPPWSQPTAATSGRGGWPPTERGNIRFRSVRRPQTCLQTPRDTRPGLLHTRLFPNPCQKRRCRAPRAWRTVSLQKRGGRPRAGRRHCLRNPSCPADSKNWAVAGAKVRPSTSWMLRP